jgi:oligopeptidase A
MKSYAPCSVDEILSSTLLQKCACREGPAWEGLSEAQRRVVDIELRDFVLGGVALEGEAKERYNAIQQQLAQLSTKFSNNVLDATKVGVRF